jgi:hypothetical protein
VQRDAELDEVVSEDEWEDQFFKLVLDKINNAVGFSHGMYEYPMHLDKYCSGAKYRKPLLTGLEWVERKLANSTA